MQSRFIWSLALLLPVLSAVPAMAAERKFEFSEVTEGQTPPGFRSAVTGQGKPGEWKVILRAEEWLPEDAQTPAPPDNLPPIAQRETHADATVGED